MLLQEVGITLVFRVLGETPAVMATKLDAKNLWKYQEFTDVFGRKKLKLLIRIDKEQM